MSLIFYALYQFTYWVNYATGQIARLRRRMAALQLLGIEQLFYVIAPCPTPPQAHTLPRPTADSRFKELSIFDVRRVEESKSSRGVIPDSCLSVPFAPSPFLGGGGKNVSYITRNKQELSFSTQEYDRY